MPFSVVRWDYPVFVGWTINCWMTVLWGRCSNEFESVYQDFSGLIMFRLNPHFIYCRHFWFKFESAFKVHAVPGQRFCQVTRLLAQAIAIIKTNKVDKSMKIDKTLNTAMHVDKAIASSKVSEKVSKQFFERKTFARGWRNFEDYQRQAQGLGQHRRPLYAASPRDDFFAGRTC